MTAGIGNTRKVDSATGLDEFRMRQALSFYPASAIRCVVHMMHSCRYSGTSARGLVNEGNKRPAWRCTLLPGSTFVLNKYFHSVVRNSIA